MNAKQRKFIEKKLIPFILRVEGNGFAMSTWISKYTRQAQREGPMYFDSIAHQRPQCGTVACIGGSIQCLKKVRGVDKMAKILGITFEQADGLFHNWEPGDTGFGWPESFRERFSNAATPYRKAQVAVALLKRVIKTNGACLNPPSEDF